MLRLLTLAIASVVCALTVSSRPTEKADRPQQEGGPAFIYRVYLTDKQSTAHLLPYPTRFLSLRAVERRNRQQLSVDSTDLPVSARYVQQVENCGATVVGRSRWHNTLLVHVQDTMAMQSIDLLPCVKSRRLVWQSPDSVTTQTNQVKVHNHFDSHDSIGEQPYGNAFQQIAALNGQQLHDAGMRGEGMVIAVIDGGFRNADCIPALQHVDIRGCEDFVATSPIPVFSATDHGTKVLSAMAVDTPHYYVGTAPKASYWLLRSENQQSEQEVEEDYWTMAAEFADSVGCDLINSSLGYNEYDDSTTSHPLWHLDGHTAFVSRSASMLAQKGIVLVNSAGNSGMGTWKKITLPADADQILTVGAVSPEEPFPIAPFSSVGPSQDGRVKPDVVAPGAPACLVDGRGVITQDSGTSFAAPIVCGLTACLWQALPHLTATQIIELVRQAGNNRAHPDNVYGYGMPDFWRAYQFGKTTNEQ